MANALDAAEKLSESKQDKQQVLFMRGAMLERTKQFKGSVHRKLLNRLNLEALAQADRARAEGEIRGLLGDLLAEEATPLSLGERESPFREILDDVFGLGLLEPPLCGPPGARTPPSTSN